MHINTTSLAQKHLVALQPSICNTGDVIAFPWCVRDNNNNKSQDWPDLPLQNKWPELCWDPDYIFSIEMFLQFQAPAHNWKESIFVSRAHKASLYLWSEFKKSRRPAVIYVIFWVWMKLLKDTELKESLMGQEFSLGKTSFS